MDAAGHERWRLEGYLPKDEFQADLEMGLARVAFMNKQWANAEQWYTDVVDNFPNSTYAPEAVYWQAVSRYKATNDHKVLGDVAVTLAGKYPESEWALRAIPWSP